MIPDLVKCPNQKTRKYVYLRISCVFWFGHFPRCGIKSKSSFLIKCYIITVPNFFVSSVLSQKMTFQKMEFPLYSQKVYNRPFLVLIFSVFNKKICSSCSQYSIVLKFVLFILFFRFFVVCVFCISFILSQLYLCIMYFLYFLYLCILLVCVLCTLLLR